MFGVLLIGHVPEHDLNANHFARRSMDGGLPDFDMLAGAVGVLMSSLTKNQIVAAVAGIITLLLFWLAGIFLQSGTDWAHHTLRYISLVYHLESLIMGIVDTRDLIFFLSFAVFFLFLTVRAVESRKWRL